MLTSAHPEEPVPMQITLPVVAFPTIHLPHYHVWVMEMIMTAPSQVATAVYSMEKIIFSHTRLRLINVLTFH